MGNQKRKHSEESVAENGGFQEKRKKKNENDKDLIAQLDATAYNGASYNNKVATSSANYEFTVADYSQAKHKKKKKKKKTKDLNFQISNEIPSVEQIDDDSGLSSFLTPRKKKKQKIELDNNEDKKKNKIKDFNLQSNQKFSSKSAGHIYDDDLTKKKKMKKKQIDNIGVEMFNDLNLKHDQSKEDYAGGVEKNSNSHTRNKKKKKKKSKDLDLRLESSTNCSLEETNAASAGSQHHKKKKKNKLNIEMNGNEGQNVPEMFYDDKLKPSFNESYSYEGTFEHNSNPEDLKKKKRKSFELQLNNSTVEKWNDKQLNQHSSTENGIILVSSLQNLKKKKKKKLQLVTTIEDLFEKGNDELFNQHSSTENRIVSDSSLQNLKKKKKKKLQLDNNTIEDVFEKCNDELLNQHSSTKNEIILNSSFQKLKKKKKKKLQLDNNTIEDVFEKCNDELLHQHSSTENGIVLDSSFQNLKKKKKKKKKKQLQLDNNTIEDVLEKVNDEILNQHSLTENEIISDSSFQKLKKKKKKKLQLYNNTIEDVFEKCNDELLNQHSLTENGIIADSSFENLKKKKKKKKEMDLPLNNAEITNKSTKLKKKKKNLDLQHSPRENYSVSETIEYNSGNRKSKKKKKSSLPIENGVVNEVEMSNMEILNQPYLNDNLNPINKKSKKRKHCDLAANNNMVYNNDKIPEVSNHKDRKQIDSTEFDKQIYGLDSLNHIKKKKNKWKSKENVLDEIEHQNTLASQSADSRIEDTNVNTELIKNTNNLFGENTSFQTGKHLTFDPLRTHESSLERPAKRLKQSTPKPSKNHDLTIRDNQYLEPVVSVSIDEKMFDQQDESNKANDTSCNIGKVEQKKLQTSSPSDKKQNKSMLHAEKSMLHATESESESKNKNTHSTIVGERQAEDVGLVQGSTDDFFNLSIPPIEGTCLTKELNSTTAEGADYSEVDLHSSLHISSSSTRDSSFEKRLKEKRRLKNLNPTYRGDKEQDATNTCEESTNDSISTVCHMKKIRGKTSKASSSHQNEKTLHSDTLDGNVETGHSFSDYNETFYEDAGLELLDNICEELQQSEDEDNIASEKDTIQSLYGKTQIDIEKIKPFLTKRKQKDDKCIPNGLPEEKLNTEISPKLTVVQKNHKPFGIEACKKTFRKAYKGFDEDLALEHFHMYLMACEEDEALAHSVQKKLENVLIKISWEVPRLHYIGKSVLLALRPSERCEVEKQKLPLKKGIFSKEEDKIIQRNWIDFCKTHNIPDNPRPFINFSKGVGSFMGVENKRRFAQFLARDLNERLLCSVYSRFQRLYLNKYSDRFTKAEDDIIINYICTRESRATYVELGRILGRDNAAVEKHCKKLMLACTEPETVKFTKEKISELLQNLMEIFETDRLDDLKDKTITCEQWKTISEKINIPYHKLRPSWLCRIYPSLFGSEEYEKLNALAEKLVCKLRERGETDWRAIDWDAISKDFDGFTADALNKKMKMITYYNVPYHLRGDLRECLEVLKNVRFRKHKLKQYAVLKKGRVKNLNNANG